MRCAQQLMMEIARPPGEVLLLHRTGEIADEIFSVDQRGQMSRSGDDASLPCQVRSPTPTRSSITKCFGDKA